MSSLTRFYSKDIVEIILLIEEHQSMHPDHGTDCACMDEFIRRLRQLTTSKTAQLRVDYVLRKALDR